MCDGTSSLANVQVSLFHGSFDSEPKRAVTLRHVLESIRTGTYAQQVRYVRHILATCGKADYDLAKRSLPAVTFAGTFAPTRGNAHLQRHSRLLHVDMDHLSDVAATKQALSDDPHVVFAFTSPSGGGLKAGVEIPPVTSAEQYAHAWRVVKAEHEQHYGVTWDPATKDVARLCYVSHDPDLFVNFDAEVFDVPPMPSPEPKPTITPRPSQTRYQPDRTLDYGERAIRTAVQMIQSAAMGTRHHTRLKAARLLGGYVAGGLLSEQEAYDVLAQALDGYTEHLTRACKTVKAGLAYGKAHPIRFDDLEAEREAWVQAWIQAQQPVAPPQHVPPVERDPWEGRRTLPLKPYTGLRLRKVVSRGQ
jgi:hypothetical protein